MDTVEQFTQDNILGYCKTIFTILSVMDTVEQFTQEYHCWEALIKFTKGSDKCVQFVWKSVIDVAALDGHKDPLHAHVVLAVCPLLHLKRMSVNLPGKRGWKDGETERMFVERKQMKSVKPWEQELSECGSRTTA
jgi:hypothetical protein